MHLTMFLSLVLTLFTSVSSSPVVTRDAKTVLLGISELSRHVTELTGKVTAYKSPYAPVTAFTIAFHDIKFLLNTTTSEVKETGSFRYDDSAEISNALQDFAPFVVTLLTEVNKKAPLVAARESTSIVHAALETLDADTTALLNALTNAVSFSVVGGISTVNAQLSAAFKTAIAVFARP